MEGRLRARRKSDLLNLVMGVVMGSLAGVANALLSHILIVAYSIVAAAYATGFYAARLLSLHKRLEYSLGRAFITYSAAFTLWWFSLYASLIQ